MTRPEPAPDAHLLIVDDDERIRSLLRRFLVRSGYFVTTARDAAQARRLLAGLDFDLIVLDVMMPGEDGLSLCASLAREGRVPVILLTALKEDVDRIVGLEIGADEVLAVCEELGASDLPQEAVRPSPLLVEHVVLDRPFTSA